MKKITLFKLAYSMNVFALVLPIGMISSGWVQLAMGGITGRTTIALNVLKLIAGVFRIVQVWRNENIFNDSCPNKFISFLRNFGAILIYGCAVAFLINLMFPSALRIFVKDSDHVALYLFGYGMVLSYVIRILFAGFFVFECARLIGFEAKVSHPKSIKKSTGLFWQ